MSAPGLVSAPGEASVMTAADADALVATLPPLDGITADSRRVAQRIAFAAYPGAVHDGRTFIDDAIARGASAVVWEAHGFAWNARRDVPNAGVVGLKANAGPIASAVYGHPSAALWMIGITGTNGKTSSAHFIAQALSRCGRRTAVAGTLGNGFVDALSPSINTTADACDLQTWLAKSRREGAVAVAMEVSSHGIDQGRVNGVAFDVALFTNLTRDHLDYHGTMAAYGDAKARLFAWPGLQTAVINAGDAFGRALIERARASGVRVITYGTDDADITAMHVDVGDARTTIAIRSTHGSATLSTPLTGAFNVQNVLGVLGVLLASDVAFDDALAALAALVPPAGRMERLGGGGADPLVVVDYAHTPDALAQVLAAMRPAVRDGRRLVCVFGCGGDRDRGKRAPMGDVAGRLADRVIVTSDNPRSEDPQAIADAIAEGLAPIATDWSIELDRARAIERAIGDAGAGDVVVVAGKGHEDYQEANGKRIAFSDVRCAADVLSRRRSP